MKVWMGSDWLTATTPTIQEKKQWSCEGEIMMAHNLQWMGSSVKTVNPGSFFQRDSSSKCFVNILTNILNSKPGKCFASGLHLVLGCDFFDSITVGRC